MAQEESWAPDAGSKEEPVRFCAWDQDGVQDDDKWRYDDSWRDSGKKEEWKEQKAAAADEAAKDDERNTQETSQGGGGEWTAQGAGRSSEWNAQEAGQSGDGNAQEGGADSGGQSGAGGDGGGKDGIGGGGESSDKSGGAENPDKNGGAEHCDKNDGAENWDKTGGAESWDKNGGAENWDKSGGAESWDKTGGAESWKGGSERWDKNGSRESWDKNGSSEGLHKNGGSQSWDQNGGWKKDTWDIATPAPNAKAFWDAQAYNKEGGVLPRKADWEEERDDEKLFTERLGSSAGLAFDQYDQVPVDLSGQKADLIPSCHTFDELYDKFQDCIPEALINNVRRCFYTKPTPVQKYAIPAGLCGRDVMCCAQTGSGKTAAFLFPIIGRMMKQHEAPAGGLTVPFEGPSKPDTLILTPTRELCVQVFEEAQKFCHRTPYRVARIYGGEKPANQMQDIARGADVMVACPGRLQDFIGRGIVDVSAIYILVLDEADRMLDMGFEPQIRDICENHNMPAKEHRQTMMFSATFPENCQKMAQDYLYNYIWVGVGIVGGASKTVDQRLMQVQPKEKYEKLFEILDDFFANRQPDERCLVFTNAKDTAKWLDEQLYEKQIDTGALHGNLDQYARETNLNRFRHGEIDVMIATDVASRGLDIEKVSYVINYDMPTDIDSYVHRIGRTGRIGNNGLAITFIACDEHGTAMENVAVLKELLRIMRDAGSATPSWLEGLIEAGDARQSGHGQWGGKDMRATWGDWNKSKGADSGWSTQADSAKSWDNWKSKDSQGTWSW